MSEAILLSIATSLATFVLHEVGLLGIGAGAARFAGGGGRMVVLAVAIGILLLHLLEIGIYTGAIALATDALHLGRLVGDVDGSNLELLYFSAEAYTSLGFGDIIPTGQMRLLVSFEPLNGLILLGWSASFLHLEVARYWRRLGESERAGGIWPA
ncbi:MAG: ion channel [Geminicoccaceae bacterium]